MTPPPSAPNDAVPELTDAARARSLLCAALLAAGRPLSAKELGTLLGDETADLGAAIADLQQTLKADALGLVVEEVAGGYRLVVDPALTPELAALLSPPPLPALSEAALETLALVAYKQPVTRGELETARGASCASTLDTLQERQLIRVAGRRDVIGRPLLYATTERFLVEFGLNSLDDLPALSEQPAEFLRS
ncbi:MAG: SMC-Scp complex subunit ScpB [Trueperaceae bacterium]|nr:SMC-Scp complex subunit ScpB [Trueperaceae bacterium]